MDAVQYADNIKAPIAITELLSITTFNTNFTAFQGPVFVCVLQNPYILAYLFSNRFKTVNTIS
jgi:hypothetical protein